MCTYLFKDVHFSTVMYDKVVTILITNIINTNPKSDWVLQFDYHDSDISNGNNLKSAKNIITFTKQSF